QHTAVDRYKARRAGFQERRELRSHSASRPPSCAASGGLELQVLIDRERVQGDRVDRMLRDSRSNPVQRPKIEERGKHYPLHRELRNLVQQGPPPSPVALPRLLLKQRIDLRIAPIRVGAFGGDERLDPGCGVAGGSRGGDDQAAQLLLTPGRIKGGPVH